MKKLIVLAFLFCFSVNAYAQEPFPCDGSFYQVFGINGMSLAYNVETDISTVAPNNAGTSMNAFGYRVQDNLAYGIFTGTNELAQLGSDGTVNNLGVVTGLPLINYPAGAISDDGFLYVYRGTDPVFNMIFVIDIDAVSVVNVLNVPGPTFTTPDLTFNPIDNRFYAVAGGGAEVPDNNLIAIDRDTGVLEIVGPTNLADDTGFASMFSDDSGNVYGHDRDTGILYVFNTQTGQPTQIGQNIIQEEVMGGVDGFFCVANPGPIAKVVPTLSEWGLIAMVALLGVIGFIAIRRRTASAGA